MKKKRAGSLAILLVAVLNLYGQDLEITGKVISATDATPLPGVSVQVKGTALGTQTGPEGDYHINVARGAVLRFSLLGYASREVIAGDQKVINIELSEDQETLSEVVVIGYGTQASRDLTGSISRIGAEDMGNMPVQSLEAALQGKAAGVFIESGSGKLGQGIKVRIRGSSSITASNQPLYVVDGIPITSESQGTTVNEPTNPLADINMNDIESVELLKDASAAAIYGSRASNGVVLITTKKGKAQATQFNVNFSTGISNPTRKQEFMNARQYVDYLRQSARNAGQYDFANGINGFPSEEAAINSYMGYLEESFDAFSAGTDWRNYEVTTDWYSRQFNENAANTRLNVSARGGNEKTRFYISGSVDDQEGILIENNFGRYSGRLNLDHTASERLKLGINLSVSRSRNDRVDNDNAFSTPGQLAALPPIQPIIDPNTGELSTTGPYYNALIEAENAFNKTIVFRNLGNIFGSYNLLPGLTFRSEFGVDILNQTEESFQGSKTQGNPTGFGDYRTVSNVNFTTNNYFTYNKLIADDHDLEFVLGMSYQRSTLNTSQVQAEGFPSDEFKKIASAANVLSGSTSGADFSFLSYFSRANYKYRNKYLLSLSARIDGSSRFGENNRYGFFPAISAGWILSEEDFLQNSNVISFLKIRGGYGLTGNAEIDEFAALALYGATFYPDLPGYRPTQIANPDLRWEKTGQIDIGFDFELFNGRISGSADVYKKDTEDLLLNVNLPSTSGFTTVLKNTGRLENKGLELLLTSHNLTGNFAWSTTLNFALNRNKVTDLDGQVIESGGFVTQRALEGEPLGVFFMPRYAGVDPQNGDALYYTEDGSTTNDYNKAFFQVVGDPNPDFTGGITNEFSFKGFDLKAFFQFVQGNDIFNAAGIYQSANGDYFDNQTVDQLNSWKQPGDITDVPQARFTMGNGTRNSSRWLYDGSYLRLKTLTLGYTLSALQLNTKVFDKARLYVSGYNLLTVTDYPGEPEVNSGAGSNLSAGVDFYTVSQPRTIVFGIDIGF